ncbi:hypothetical protein EPN52_05390 [bacterium]|nr:MAG: hypothetical protein EPN52_05390 [bacterium]
MAHVFYESEVACAPEEVADRLRDALAPGEPDQPGTWYELDVPFEDLHLPRLGRFTRKVLMNLGEPEQRTHATLVPIRWRVTDSRAFPEFHGWIEVVPLSSTHAKLAILGDYTPPLGPLGLMIDRVGGNAVAEITVRRLLQRLRLVLEAGTRRRG